jgi:hypothetical protein
MGKQSNLYSKKQKGVFLEISSGKEESRHPNRQRRNEQKYLPGAKFSKGACSCTMPTGRTDEKLPSRGRRPRSLSRSGRTHKQPHIFLSLIEVINNTRRGARLVNLCLAGA